MSRGKKKKKPTGQTLLLQWCPVSVNELCEKLTHSLPISGVAFLHEHLLLSKMTHVKIQVRGDHRDKPQISSFNEEVQICLVASDVAPSWMSNEMNRDVARGSRHVGPFQTL